MPGRRAKPTSRATATASYPDARNTRRRPAVVEIDEQGSDEAGRISNSFMAMLNCKDEAWGPTRFDFFYYPEIRKARYVLYGTAAFIAAALGTFDSLCAPKED